MRQMDHPPSRDHGTRTLQTFRTQRISPPPRPSVKLLTRFYGAPVAGRRFLTMPLTKQQALDMLASDDLIGIGMEAHQLRLKKNDPRVATYQVDRNINYTNFCTEYCSFCAFYRPIGAKDGYILSFDEIFKKIEEMLELGGNGVLQIGRAHPDLRIEYFENLLSSIKQRYPQIHLHCFSAPEITCIAEVSGLSLHNTIARLADAGL